MKLYDSINELQWRFEKTISYHRTNFENADCKYSAIQKLMKTIGTRLNISSRLTKHELQSKTD